ncbi:MAG: hypothetical protein ACP5H9_03950 [Candidatus Woesearchaeota archaeon]
MGFFSKLAFWKKKEDDLGLEKLDKEALGFKTGVEEHAMSPSFEPQQDFQQSFNRNFPQQQYPQQYPSYQQIQPVVQGSREEIIEKNLEIISAKLDTLKAAIENLNQRISNLEMQMKGRW